MTDQSITTIKSLNTLKQLIGAYRAPGERTDANARMRVALALGLNVQTLAHYLAGRRTIGPIAADAIARVADAMQTTTESAT